MNAKFRMMILSGAALGLVACAHAQQTATPEAQNTPAPVAPPPAPAPAPAPVQEQPKEDLAAILNQQVLHFDFDKSLLSDESRTQLQTVADAMKSQPEAKIQIAGNCDELGTEEYNLALGQRRADVAKQYLVSLGVSNNRVKTVSYGKERPVDEAHTQEAYAKNRRDDLQPLEK